MLRANTARVAVIFALAGAAAVLLAVGLGLCIWGLYQILAPALGEAGASAIAGLVVLVVGGGLLWLAIRMSR